MTRARIFMQKLLLNMHIIMHSKIKKYAKNNLWHWTNLVIVVYNIL